MPNEGIPSIIIPGAIPGKTRDLILLVFDGYWPAMQYLHRIWVLDIIRLDEILSWLIKNRITGKEFVRFIIEAHQGSLLWTLSYVLKEVDRSKEAKPIIVGRDTK